jgi:hypothetical protein
MTARSKSVAINICLRERRSTKTPANGATTRNGSIRAIIKPVVAIADPDIMRTNPNSAMNENQVPSSLIAWPVHSLRKFLLPLSNSP